MSMNKEKKLQVKDLTISFRTVNGKLQAVRDISFDLYKGETLAIVGESGSGKSATSKTILGISAANTIIEGGEILYDGKDLLKISEEDFCTIRGDKIAMVFQDPLSSLNPIMRVGKQLTEAMLLKNKANRKECRKKLSNGMKALNANMVGAGCNVDSAMFSTFKAIIKEQAKYEGPYDTAHTNAKAALKAAEDMLLAIDKDALSDPKGDARELKNYAAGAVDHFVVRDGGKMKSILGELTKNAAEGMKAKDFSALKKTVLALKALLEQALAEEKPDFFALGCYVVLDKKTVGQESAAELNRLTAGSLNGSFIQNFIATTKKAMEYSAHCSVENMGAAIVKAQDVRSAFAASLPEEAQAKKMAAEVADAVEKAIDPLETVKDSAAYTFRVSLNSALDTYYRGVTGNVAEKKRFEKQTAKYEAAVAKGKTPNGKVAPLALVDLDVAGKSVLHVLDNIVEQFNARMEAVGKFDFDQRAQNYIRWMRETALGEIHKVTHSMAKDTAIRTMEQVGITEARKRYRQYPFEFSGGMRQRIVIAISLMADPDILICDEPTTALDVTIQAQILELMQKLQKELGMAIIMITHDLGVVAQMCDEVIVMYAGSICEQGTADEIFYNPKHEYTKGLMRSIPTVDNDGEKLEPITGTPIDLLNMPAGCPFAPRCDAAMKICLRERCDRMQINEYHQASCWMNVKEQMEKEGEGNG